MARLSVEEIMKQIAVTVNQEATAPTAGSDEYNLWLEYINRGVFEWANTTDWEALRRTFKPSVVGVSQATVSLPFDYNKLAASPRLYSGQDTEGTEFPEVMPEQKGLYTSVDKYFTQVGDISNGYSLIFHPATLASGASLVVEYFCMPTSLASPAQVPLVSDSQFLIDRSIAFIFEARSDSRFQTEEQKARDRLLTMVENANASKFNSYSNSNPVMTTARKQGFRLGRD